MKIIVRGKSTGKTMELLKESASTGNYILVGDRSKARNIFLLAHQVNLSIPYPVTVDEIAHGKTQGTSIRRDGILVDDAEQVLQQLLGVPINTLTITIAEDGENG